VGLDNSVAPALTATGETRTIDGRVFDEVVLAGFDEEADGDDGGSLQYVYQDEEGLYPTLRTRRMAGITINDGPAPVF
jgi:hypothetical protein